MHFDELSSHFFQSLQFIDGSLDSIVNNQLDMKLDGRARKDKIFLYFNPNKIDIRHLLRFSEDLTLFFCLSLASRAHFEQKVLNG